MDEKHPQVISLTYWLIKYWHYVFRFVKWILCKYNYPLVNIHMSQTILQLPYWQSWPSAEISYSRSHYAHISIFPLTRSLMLWNQLPSKVGFAGSPAAFFFCSVLTSVGMKLIVASRMLQLFSTAFQAQIICCVVLCYNHMWIINEKMKYFVCVFLTNACDRTFASISEGSLDGADIRLLS